jgi:hypothetical protein
MIRSELFIPYSRPQEHVSLSAMELTGSHFTHLCQGSVQQHHILNISLPLRQAVDLPLHHARHGLHWVRCPRPRVRVVEPFGLLG